MGIIPRCPKLVWEEKTTLIKIKMKKLSLEKLKLAADDVLQRDQLSTIYGGSAGCGYMSCHCTDGGHGSWTGYYCDDEWVAAILRYCAISGTCH
jgi:hypothetical protein